MDHELLAVVTGHHDEQPVPLLSEAVYSELAQLACHCHAAGLLREVVQQ